MSPGRATIMRYTTLRTIYIIILILVFILSLIIIYYIFVMQFMNQIEEEGRIPIRDIDLIPASEKLFDGEGDPAEKTGIATPVVPRRAVDVHSPSRVSRVSGLIPNASRGIPARVNGVISFYSSRLSLGTLGFSSETE
jgi:hypothetical protein